jgi:hypothetical protein
MFKSQSGSEDKKVAIHEASHALMFDALAIPIGFVTIEAGCGGEESSYEGCVKLASDMNNVCLVIAATLAGPAASFFIANVAMDKEATLKFRSDQRKIYDIYSQQSGAGTRWEKGMLDFRSIYATTLNSGERSIR